MELTDQGAEFDPRPIAPKPLLEGPLAALLEWQVSELKVNVQWIKISVRGMAGFDSKGRICPKRQVSRMTTENTIDTDTAALAPRPIIQGPLAALLNGRRWRRARTRRIRCGRKRRTARSSRAYCEVRGEPYLPADPMTIRAFIEDRREGGQKARHDQALRGDDRAGRMSPPACSIPARARRCG